MKIDPHKHQQKYLKWKEKVKNGILGISKENSDLILKFIYQMEIGLNVAIKSKKGARSYIRLNTLRNNMMFFARQIKKNYDLDDLSKVSEEQIHYFFNNLKNGSIKRSDGKNYTSPSYFVKTFKAFWHWLIQIKRKENIDFQDITLYLDTKQEKSKWVYLTEDEVKKLCDNSKYIYKVLIMFLYDSGIRSPTELVNVKVRDFSEDFKKLDIRDETSKTFGRKINLLICSSIMKKYILENELKEDDFVFDISPPSVNKYLKRLAERILGDKLSPAGEKYSNLTMYDFRHSSACYWLPRYKSESALKYRFGWKKSEMIHYYTELLGMRDTISQEDMLVDVTKTELEQRLDKTEKEKELLKDKVENLEMQMRRISELIQKGMIIVRNQN